MAEFDYNKLLEKAQKKYKQCSTDAEKRILESIFPELMKLEDEEIIQALLKFFSEGANSNETTCDIPDKKIVEWLKKQVELKSNWSENDEKIRNEIVQIIRRYIGYVEEESCEPHLKDFLIIEAKESIAWLEKQCKQDKQKHTWSEDNENWKPTEEQMQTLHVLLNEGVLCLYPEDKRVLTTLYEDLQKLLKK